MDASFLYVHQGHCSRGQYCAPMSWPGTAIGTLTPGDIKPEIFMLVFTRYQMYTVCGINCYTMISVE